MRHIGRTHGVSIAWLWERFQHDEYDLSYCDTADQAADIYTKAFTDKFKWAHACELAGVLEPSQLPRVIREHAERWKRQGSSTERAATESAPAAPAGKRGEDNWEVSSAPCSSRGGTQ